MNLNKELRVMHACELGATGVYRGHQCAARYFHRHSLAELGQMKTHEKEHASIFRELLKSRESRLCLGYPLFFWGGLIYGVVIGLLGLKAIGTSTYTIETIVDKEFDIALAKLNSYPSICKTIRQVQLEERQHREAGSAMATHNNLLSKLVEKIAQLSAYTAKGMASIL